MKKLKKGKLQKQLSIFLSTCIFSGAAFYCGNAVQAAPVFGSGTGINSVIAGTDLIASGMSSTAVGYNNEASAPHAAAFGSGNLATGQFSLAAGYKNTAGAIYAIAVGGNNVASGQYSITLGVGNNATSGLASAVGNSNTASGNASSAFGYSNTASGQSSVAFGRSNTASGNRSSAFGYLNTASAQYASAFGYTNEAIEANTTAVGYLNVASGVNATAIGNKNIASKESASAFGRNNTASGESSSAFGYNNTASGESSSAVGYLNNATAAYASAVGRDNTASGRSSSAFGADNAASGEFASAFGRGNTASGGISNAFGALNTASGARSNAFGYSNTVQAARSTAVGESNKIESSATDSFALGNKISITLKDSVALGSNSVAAAINIVTAHSSSSKWAGVTDVVGVVSVGSSGATRQIQNVAAGAVSATSTDAVNGSQLYAVQQEAAKHNTVTSGDNNIELTETANSAGGTDYEVKLADDLEIASSIDVGNGNIVLDGDTSTITAGSVVIDGDAGTIGGLTNTTWDADNYVSGQAATEDQLKAISDEMADIADLAAAHNTVSNTDGNITITETTNADDGIDYELALADELQIGSDVKIDGNAGAIDLGSGNIMLDGANSTISTGNIMLDGSSDTITAGSVSIDGAAGTIGGLTNTTWDADNITSGQAATEDQLKTVSNSAVKYDTDSNGNVDNSKITLGGNGGTTITNVAPGEVSSTSTDAVNGSQLYAVQQDISSINKDISKLGDEIDSVGALSAAMAGLHPRFQDGNKGEFAMAVGGYGGKSAVAMGGFYAPNEKVMFSLGLGVSEGGRKMGNFGVNFALDRARDRTKEPRDILYSRKEVDAALAAQNEQIQILLQEIELLKVKAE